MKSLETARILLAIVLGILLSSTAAAKDLMVAPLVTSNLNSRTVVNLTNLIASEIDFSGKYDFVEQIESKPKGLTSSCVKSVSCLSRIAKAVGTEAMVVGSVNRRSSDLEILLVLYSDGKIIRMKKERMPNDATTLASSVTPFVDSLLTGKDPVAAKKEEAKPVAQFADLEDEEEDELDGFSLEVSDDVEAKRKARERERQRVEQQRLEEEKARNRAAREAELEAQREEMEAEARRLAEQSDDSDLSMDDDFDFEFGQGELSDAEEESSSLSNEEETTLDFDRPAKKSKSKKRVQTRERKFVEQPTRTTRKVQSGKLPATASLTARVGASTFQGFNFFTYGAEVGVHLNPSVSITLGADGYATQQYYRDSADENGNGDTDETLLRWSTLVPINIGALYHFSGGIVKPFAGMEIQLMPGVIDRNFISTSTWAYGIRARGGLNFLIADNFALTAALNLGMWTGEPFTQIPKDPDGTQFMSSSGIVPVINLGTRVLF